MSIDRKSEPRRYMGPKWARVPRGEIVRLVAVVNGNMGVFEWNGERFNFFGGKSPSVREGMRADTFI